MKHLTSDEIRQRFTEYLKELEEGQGHKQALSEDQLLEDQMLPIITAIAGVKTEPEILMFPMNQEIIDVITDWFLPFSDITKVQQEFGHYYGGTSTSERKYFLQRISDALKGYDVIRKKQFLDLISREVQIKRTPDFKINQELKKEFDEKIENKGPIQGDFIFKLYQNRYIQLKQTGNREEINTQLANNFSDKEESYIWQISELDSPLSAIRLILLKEFGITEKIKNLINNNMPISNQIYYDYINDQPYSRKKELFNKLCNNDQFFIDIILKVVSKNSFEFKRINSEEPFIHHIQLIFQKERKAFIAAYILNNPENVINYFLKECDFIPSVNKNSEKGLADKKPNHGELFLSLYEKKFFIDPLKKIAEGKNITFNEEGFYQIRRNKEQEARKYILELANHAIAITFLLGKGVTPSDIPRQLTSQIKEALSQLNLGIHTHPMPSNNLVYLVKTVIDTIGDQQLKDRRQSIMDNARNQFSR